MTGQHVSVPIRVQTRSLHPGEIASDSAYEADSISGGFWVNLSWLHLLLLIFLTVLLLVACKSTVLLLILIMLNHLLQIY